MSLPHLTIVKETDPMPTGKLTGSATLGGLEQGQSTANACHFRNLSIVLDPRITSYLSTRRRRIGRPILAARPRNKVRSRGTGPGDLDS